MSLLDRIVDPVAQLMRPPPGLEFDYSQPAGEPALVPADSISWRIFKNPVTLFVGGVTAVILELAEPSVRSGVWDHSSFRSDAVLRLRRTGAAAMMTVYGPQSAAIRMIARVGKVHAAVAGETPDGTPYRADDPRLLNWVQATASFGFIEAYSRLASPLSEAETSLAFAEAGAAAQLYGATGAPGSLAEWEALLAAFAPTLEPSPTIRAFLEIMKTTPVMPGAGAVQRLLVAAAVELLPADVRRRLQLEEERPGRASFALVRAMARLADAVPLRSAPPARASVRMGRSPTFLYGRRE